MGAPFQVNISLSVSHKRADSKPLSIFGLVHKLGSSRRLDEYPSLRTEGEDEGERGLVAYLRDHFMDLEGIQQATPDAPATDSLSAGAFAANLRTTDPDLGSSGDFESPNISMV